MTEGYTADTDVIRNAANILNSAHQFFNDRLTTLRQVAGESYNEPFAGGHGKTGGFQRGLLRFDGRFRDVLGEFIEDETNFVLFLEQALARLTGTASLYDSSEHDNALRMTAISGQLDGERE